MIGGEWPGKGFENMPPIRDLEDKGPAIGRSKSFQKEKRPKGWRVTGRMASLMSSQLHHTEGLNLGRLLISFSSIEL